MTAIDTAAVVDVADTLKRLRAGVELARQVEIERQGLIVQAVRAGTDWDDIAASLGRLQESDTVRAEFRRFLDGAEAWTECNPGSRFYGLTNTEIWELITAFEEENEE